jgi:hypothetical protein
MSLSLLVLEQGAGSKGRVAGWWRSEEKRKAEKVKARKTEFFALFAVFARAFIGVEGGVSR